MLLRAESSTIASVLRNRICMMQGSVEDVTLHEGIIATEFGVSRTPIRQVLQKLAYERLVETRSGVGTIISPLVAEDRDKDLIVLKELFRAAAACAGDTPAAPEVLERLASAQAISALATADAQGYLNTRSELLEISSDAAPDAILGDAMRAAHWRQIRWRMADQAWAQDGAAPHLTEVFRYCAERCRADGLKGVFAALVEAEL